MNDQRKLFGTDGVRGRANSHPMNSEVALNLGRAAAHVFHKQGRRHALVIGKDTRLSGYMIETALASGVCSMGADVLLVGPLPTPGVAFITRGMRADGGVMISASHNSHTDNGIKFFDSLGCKLDDELELRMERLIETGEIDQHRATAEYIGKASRIDDAAGRYITFLKSTVPAGMTFDGMKVVLDCAHGAAYRIAPAVFSELGAHVVAVGVHPDGRNINAGCGSTHPEYMARFVRDHGADLGCAFDGDADRIIMCDANGTIVDGDAIMAICARDMHERGVLNHGTVVTTSMSNIGFDMCLKPLGIQTVRTDVGDRYVKQAMRHSGYNLGGEQSGHVIFSDHNTTGDGILGGLQVMATMRRTGKSLAQLCEFMQTMPQVLQNVRVKEKKAFDDIPAVHSLVKQYTAELGDRGRVLVRYSGTEPIARVMIEGEDAERIREMTNDLATVIHEQVG